MTTGKPKFKKGDIVRLVGNSPVGRGMHGRIVDIELDYPDWGYTVDGRSGLFFADEEDLELVSERFTEEEKSMKKKMNEQDMGGGPWLPENEIIGMKVTGESGGEMSINLTSDEKADLESCVEDYIIQAEEKHGSESDMVIMTAASKALRWIERICAKDCARLDPEDVIINWVDDGPEDEFAVATGNSQSVYDFVEEMYKNVSDYYMGSGTRGKPESDDEEFMEAGHENLDAEGFIDIMTNGAGATPLFDPYNGTVEKDGTVVLNVIAHREQVSYKDVQDGFAEQAAEYGWKLKSFGYSDDLTSEIVDDGNVEIDVVFAPMQQVSEKLENELKKGDDGWTTIGQPVGEASGEPLEATKFIEAMMEDDDSFGGEISFVDGEQDSRGEVKILFTTHDRQFRRGPDKKIMDMVDAEARKFGWALANFGWKDNHEDFTANFYVPMSVNEAKVVVDANDVWDVLELLDNDIANKELTDLINSHVRTEEEIMDAINELCGETISKKELNTLLSGRMVTLVDYLGLDVEQYESNGEFVDSDKPTSVELENTDGQKPEEVKSQDKTFNQDGENKTLVTGEEKKKEMSDAEAATIMGGASATDMDAADIGVSSHEVADPYRKPVCEMTIEQEVPSPQALSNMLWGQGKENLEELVRAEVVDDGSIMQMLEDMGLRNLTEINDLFSFDFENVLDSLGLDAEAWSQNLEIKPIG